MEDLHAGGSEQELPKSFPPIFILVIPAIGFFAIVFVVVYCCFEHFLGQLR